MPRWTIIAGASIIAALVLIPEAVRAQSEEAGTWQGPVYQPEEQAYSVVIELDGLGGGRTVYPDFACGGVLTGGPGVYTETIDRNRAEGCIDSQISVSVSGDTMSIQWSGSWEGEPYAASAILQRVGGGAAAIEALRFHWMEERTYIANNIAPFVLKPETERALKPGNPIHECGPATHCPEMIVLPAGDFMMGSPDGQGNADEHPQHKVTIARSFAVSKFEVTWDDWEACVSMRGCDGAPTGDSGYGRDKHPLINVSWDQAKAYAAWLSLMTGKEYRLLSESQWEYAARAGSTTVYSFGDDPNQLCQYDNLADQTVKRTHPNWMVGDCDDGQELIAVVGSYKPNAFGLHDMHGNVTEWVEDCYESSYEGAPADGSARTSTECSFRVFRGGSWGSLPQGLRSAHRERYVPKGRFIVIGFRLARTLLPP